MALTVGLSACGDKEKTTTAAATPEETKVMLTDSQSTGLISVFYQSLLVAMLKTLARVTCLSILTAAMPIPAPR